MEGAPSTLACGPEVRMTSEEKVYALEKKTKEPSCPF